MAGRTSEGYGQFDGVWTAHRFAYTVAHGAIPPGFVVRHQCDTRLCCNPAHLSVGSHADNVRDRVQRRRSARGTENGRSVVYQTRMMFAAAYVFTAVGGRL